MGAALRALGASARPHAGWHLAYTDVAKPPHLCPFEKMHTASVPLEQAEDAIHALAGEIRDVNPVHLAIVPGASRVPWGGPA